MDVKLFLSWGFGLVFFLSPRLRNCNVPEEPEDDDLIHPTYEKTYKKKWVLDFLTSVSTLEKECEN